MNWVLIMVIAIMAWNLVWGYRKGFLLVVYSMVSWIIALFLVTWLSPHISEYLSPQFSGDIPFNGVVYLISYIITMVILKSVEGALGIVSEMPVLSGINKLVGLCAGGIKGCLLIWLLFLLIAFISETDMGAFIIPYIYKEDFLTWIYENNLLFQIIRLI